MNVDVAKQFITVFEDFLTIFVSEWPNLTTDSQELKKIFETAEYIEKCVNKLCKRQMLDSFLTQIKKSNKACLVDPPCYVLKKILQSEADIMIVDCAINIFMELFGEKRLEDSLVVLMKEKAANDVIVGSFKPNKKDIIEIQCQLVLNLMNDCDSIIEIIKKENSEFVRLLLYCLANPNVIYQKQLEVIKSDICVALRDKSATYQWLWRMFMTENKEQFINICTEYSELFSIVTIALSDAGKIIKENIDSQYYYIDLKYSELIDIVRWLFINEDLKQNFVNSVQVLKSETVFWDGIFKQV